MNITDNTPAAESLRDHVETIDRESVLETLANKSAYLVMTAGYWGRGPTPAEAAKQAKESGARSDMSALLILVIGDDKPEVNEYGHTLRDQGSISVRIAMFNRLSVLLNLKD